MEEELKAGFPGKPFLFLLHTPKGGLVTTMWPLCTYSPGGT